MTRRSRNKLIKDIKSLEDTFEEAFKGGSGAIPDYDSMDTKKLYGYEKALLTAKKLLAPFSWEMKHL